MNSESYCVMYGDCVLGKGMSLDNACLFLKALMEQAYNEREVEFTIKRESNDVETYRR